MGMIHVQLYRAQCRRIQKHHKKAKSRVEATRCRILLLLNEGKSVKLVSEMVGCVRATVYHTIYRFEDYGEDCIYDRRCDNAPRKITPLIEEKILEYIDKTPKDYGWHRANWTLELFSKQLNIDTGIELSISCLCGLLKSIGCKRKRPCQVLRIPVKGRRKILKRILLLVKRASPNDEVFYADEADVNLNPKIGPAYMRKGKQLKVVTPGKNVKRYVAGALNARTGKLVHIFGERKNSDLFILLLRTMLKAYRKSRTIHLVLDNYIIHKSKKVNAFLREIGPKIKLHFLPPYSPNDNKIEIIWKHMHDHVTRNHKHATIDSLIADVKFFLDNRPINGKSKISTMKMAA